MNHGTVAFLEVACAISAAPGVARIAHAGLPLYEDRPGAGEATQGCVVSAKLAALDRAVIHLEEANQLACPLPPAAALSEHR